MKTTGKILIEIIDKYIFSETKKNELMLLLINQYYRHLSFELDQIKDLVNEEEKIIIDTFRTNVF